MSQSDSTVSTDVDLPSALHILAAHITEHPIPRPYGLFPLWLGGVRVSFHVADYDAAVAFAATLHGLSVAVEHYGANDATREFYSITISGRLPRLLVAVEVSPDAVEGDTVESVKSRVESELAALAGEPVTAGSVTA